MRWLSVLLVTTLLMTRAAMAQIVQVPTPLPLVTAASAVWQLRGDPVFYSGAFYDRSGPTVFFDGNVMVRTGVFEGVPLYVDAASTAYTVVFVPVGGKLMRPYGRRAEGPARPEAPVAELPQQRPVDTTGVAPAASLPRPAAISRRPAVESIPRPSSNIGIWISYRGTHWHSAGEAVSYSADRFVRVGQYRGFPVYRDKRGPADTVYIPAVKGGPLAPFRRG